MSRFQLDDWVQDPVPETRARRRRLLLIVAFCIIVGLILGYWLTHAWLASPVPQTVELSRAEQDDYILMVAETYAVDRNVELAQQRLARLNDPHTTERIIALAKVYAPQGDYVAQRLALLAIAAGSKDKTLAALAATVIAPTATATPIPSRAPQKAIVIPSATNTLAPNYVVVTSEPTNTPYYIVITGVPTNTFTPRPTIPRSPTPADTPIVETDADRPEMIDPLPLKFVAARVPINVPEYAGFASAEIRLIARPKTCTPPDHMPPIVTETLLLCAGQTYAPIQISGNNLTLYGDPTALVQGQPRNFAITVQGNNVSLVGVHAQGATHGDDLNQWLCLYPHCFHTPIIGGALGYGGGVLLKNTSNAAVLNSQFNGGTTGVFSFRGYSNKIFNNSFSDHNGWGIMLMYTRHDYVVHNQFARINRECMGVDDVHHSNGCESSALAMTQVRDTLVYDNTCRRASDCYYANGDGGYGSTNIKFYNNQCAGALNNCFEVTFGVGHEFDYNTAADDPESGSPCDYPFWIGGSTAYFGPNNHWNCLHDFDAAVNDARSTADQPTEALALVLRPTLTPPPTPTLRFSR
ncbi:MAG TPA: right-handed parallel beta-helix repeat-containing protein [Anaerolineae bacterium]|nr:right-handed parallel beta-helix repeat-containing protein [Anaerolineae bacterium]